MSNCIWGNMNVIGGCKECVVKGMKIIGIYLKIYFKSNVKFIFNLICINIFSFMYKINIEFKGLNIRYRLRIFLFFCL